MESGKTEKHVHGWTKDDKVKKVMVEKTVKKEDKKVEMDFVKKKL